MLRSSSCSGRFIYSSSGAAEGGSPEVAVSKRVDETTIFTRKIAKQQHYIFDRSVSADGLSESINMARREKNPIVFV